MEPRLLFLILVGIAIGLSCLAGYWRKKAGEAAFAAALLADKAEDRDRHCRLAVMAGHRDACRMFCFAHPDFYEDRHPLKPFRFRGISVTFYGHYYPSRYKRLLDEEQRGFCRTLYAFKEGENHGIDFFKACMAALPVDTASCHVMFMPCSNWIKYGQRFKRLDLYITTHRKELTSGLYDVDVHSERESLHECKGSERILERNYNITGDIKGKRIIIVDDVFTSGQSLTDYKEEIERCGGEVVAAIFYGKTVTVPPLFLIKAHVWGGHIVRAITHEP
ncbi:MAG: orotate phosphoribosyltransferase [Bacteroidetes bacterium]|uniref:Orotate phosphoribosyltransferase n=1 Tax=Candidatus Cryptobacteroides excrementipullorum TaxID=2840761 RepID=A0A9D9NLR2_9BACT|nr:orotate phosphoribosyltransferase [Candidatus Cryptobacteroides excrementipullorum]